MSSSISPNGSASQPNLLQPFSIPDYLSTEAKQYLNTCEISSWPIDNVGIFDLARKGFAERTQATSDLAKGQYVDSIKEEVIAGVPCGDVQIKPNPDARNDKVVFYCHGGAFTLGSWKHLMQVFTPVAFHAGCSRAVAADYRLASDINPYPAGLDDCVGVYRKLAEEVGAKNIYILGDSAGGNLALRAIQ
jgi:acetyl esterase/lipase